MVRATGVWQFGMGVLAFSLSSSVVSAGLTLDKGSFQLSPQLSSSTSKPSNEPPPSSVPPSTNAPPSASVPPSPSVSPSTNVPLKDFSGDMERAEKAFNSEDVVKAIKILRGVAEQNYLPAQVRLGELLDYAEQNEEAVGWYMMAANQGYAAAEHHLGAMYVIGEGIAVDFEKAVYWTRKSAENNYLAAVKTMAQSYKHGEMGLEIDLEQARYWEIKIPPLEAAYKEALQSKMTTTEASKGKNK